MREMNDITILQEKGSIEIAPEIDRVIIEEHHISPVTAQITLNKALIIPTNKISERYLEI